MVQALKFTGIAQQGEIIRGHDFRPRPGCGPCYMQGVVIDACNTDQGHLAFKVRVTDRVLDGEHCAEEIGRIGYIPHQVSFLEWDGRVEVVREADAQEIAQVLREIGGI